MHLLKKSLLPLAAALCLSWAAAAQSVADLDTKFGFRDVKFETDTSAIEGLAPAESTASKYTATRPADVRKVGKATINSITYGFFEGKLYEVTLVAKGLTNSHALRDALEGQFGEGTLVSAAGQDRNWDGKLVRLTYREDPAFHNSTVKFVHKKLNEKQQAAQKSVKKAESDL